MLVGKSLALTLPPLRFPYPSLLRLSFLLKLKRQTVLLLQGQLHRLDLHHSG